MKKNDQVIIIGGGLAGLTCAIHLLRTGLPVMLIEKTVYPQHKVCGEYVSNEVLPYLSSLGINPFLKGAVGIEQLTFVAASGTALNTELPLGGFGLSRYQLDQYLYERVVELGGIVETGQVTDVHFRNDEFEVLTQLSGILKAKLVIGAYGKRSALDQKLSRSFIQQKSHWLAVKSHYSGAYPKGLVGLYHFEGGYCGVSGVENGRINICYLADYNSFKKYKHLAAFEQQVLHQNKPLQQILKDSKMLFEQPMSISQVSFAKKEPVCEHILMIGDTAGLIHPLCGNGMAMAIHSAKICAELSVSYLEGTITRKDLEKKYSKAWNLHFSGRIRAGRLLSAVIRKKLLFRILLALLAKFPHLLTILIKRTHGQPIQ